MTRWAIRSEKSAGNDLSTEEGKNSRDEDFKGEVFRIVKTSEGVTGGREYRVEPARDKSGNTKMVKDG